MAERTVELFVDLEGVTPTAVRVRELSVREALFDCYRAVVDLTSTELVDVDALIGTKGTARIKLGADAERCFNGVVTSAEIEAAAKDREIYLVRVEIEPRLALLRLGRNSRIFQEKSIPDVVKAVVEEAGLADAFEWDLRATYEPHANIVQYDESDYDFVTRLLHEEGIGFAVHNDIDAEKVQVFDDAASLPPIEGQATLLDRSSTNLDHDVVSELRERHAARSDGAMLRGYDFERPTALLEAEKGLDSGGLRQVYAHPPGSREQATLDRRVERMLERLGVRARTFEGGSDNVFLEPGKTFTLEGHPRTEVNGDLRVTAVTHRARGFVESDEDSDDAGDADTVYENWFEALTIDTPYRPLEAAPAPNVGGVQVAIVTVPGGEEIHCDENGRVKVRFPWDRSGITDDKSSTFVRVGQLALGGSMLIPRIDFEVIVDFERGDVDVPFVSLHLYNGEHRPPYELPGGNIRSSFQTATTGGGPGANEMRMDDTAGAEEIFFNASKDMTMSIENEAKFIVTIDEEVQIGSNRQLGVGTEFTAKVDGSRSCTVGANQSTNAGGNLGISVGGSEKLDVGGMRKVNAGGDLQENTTGSMKRTVGAVQGVIGVNGVTRKVLGSSTQKVAAAWLEVAGGSRAVSAANMIEAVGALKMVKAKTIAVACGAAYAETGVAQSVKCGGDRADNAGAALSMAAGGGIKIEADNIVISAESKLVLRAGGCSIELTSGGDVTVKAASKLDLRGAKGIHQALHKSA